MEFEIKLVKAAKKAAGEFASRKLDPLTAPGRPTFSAFLTSKTLGNDLGCHFDHRIFLIVFAADQLTVISIERQNAIPLLLFPSRSVSLTDGTFILSHSFRLSLILIGLSSTTTLHFEQNFFSAIGKHNVLLVGKGVFV
ncbi:uncharacterized protein CDAR_583471 [Caerostris darwini]|uniref:Uncharacterized protein n=1 Tax=Caerostris darwini TaxID=1538125 RepID=A0AAV4PX50_9ARAC|nr:uncharacterized protein CDAR_583471 [Caerostris darwini]